MSRFMLSRLGLVAVLLGGSTAMAQQPSFDVKLGEDGRTIGEIKPIYINPRSVKLPAIPLQEVARRYRKLFDESKDPQVRIDALHRLTNLQAMTGQSLGFTPEEEKALYQSAIDSYEMIVGSGVYYGRIDELLYQTAKAYDFIGRQADSRKRLEQLAGLYPDSPFATEARFRVAESYFTDESYVKSEEDYRKVIAAGPNTNFYHASQYMLAWSLLKQGRRDEASREFLTVLDRIYSGTDGFASLEAFQGQFVDDTLRVFSMSFAEDKGATGLEALLAREGTREYAYLMYDRLADYYVGQQRYEDSAATSRAFIQRFPGHPAAPDFAIQIVEAYDQGRFAEQARIAREQYVVQFAPAKAQAASVLPARQDAALRSYLGVLGDYYYRTASAAAPSVAQPAWVKAGNYLRQYGETYPADAESGSRLLLAGEAFKNAGQNTEALAMYQRAAYDSPAFDQSSEAGYAAALTAQALVTGTDDSIYLDEALRFADKFPQDRRSLPLLVDVGNRMLARHDDRLASQVGERIVADKRATPVEKRGGLLLMGHGAYAQERYDDAERDLLAAMAIVIAGENPPLGRSPELREKVAASIYKQGELAESQGKRDVAVNHYLRIGKVVPESSLNPAGRFDAATVLLEDKQWDRAISLLTSFGKEFPQHALAKQVPDKLIYAQLQKGDKSAAADVLVASAGGESAEVLWERKLQGAGLYREAGKTAAAVSIYEAFVSQPQRTTDQTVAVRQDLIALYREQGRSGDQLRMHQSIIEDLEQVGGKAGREARLAAASSALVLANVRRADFDALPLKAPLKQSMAAKKAAMEQAITHYKLAISYGGTAQATQANYWLAVMHQRLAKDLMASERPANLDELQSEQYSVLLEEQAYPFEEKAISLYEANTQRTKDGIYDQWVKDSYAALAAIFPARYQREDKMLGVTRELQ